MDEDYQKDVIDLVAFVRNWDAQLQTVSLSIGNPALQIFGANPQRWGFIIWCSSVGPLLRPIASVPGSWAGIPIPTTNQLPLVLDYRQLGGLIGMPWIASFAGNAVVSAIESTWKKV